MRDDSGEKMEYYDGTKRVYDPSLETQNPYQSPEPTKEPPPVFRWELLLLIPSIALFALSAFCIFNFGCSLHSPYPDYREGMFGLIFANLGKLAHDCLKEE